MDEEMQTEFNEDELEVLIDEGIVENEEDVEEVSIDGDKNN